MAIDPVPKRNRGVTATVTIALVFVLPILASVAQHAANGSLRTSWWGADRSSSGLSPDPAAAPEAIVQVFAARTVGWRGALGVHTWIALKPTAASRYTRYEVMGWGVRRGRQALRVGTGVPDGRWFGAMPTLLAEVRGTDADRAIETIERIARAYPYTGSYRIWPGPNSNTFTAYVARQVPQLRLHLPPTAVGKDYLPWTRPLAWAPSGTGIQLSVGGLFGFMLAVEEGVEVQLLGLTAGIDVLEPALKLPGLGRLGAMSSDLQTPTGEVGDSALR